MQISKTNRFRQKCQRAMLSQLTIIPGCTYNDEAMLTFSRYCGRYDPMIFLSEYTRGMLNSDTVSVPQLTAGNRLYGSALRPCWEQSYHP